MHTWHTPGIPPGFGLNTRVATIPGRMRIGCDRIRGERELDIKY